MDEIGNVLGVGIGDSFQAGNFGGAISALALTECVLSMSSAQRVADMISLDLCKNTVSQITLLPISNKDMKPQSCKVACTRLFSI